MPPVTRTTPVTPALLPAQGRQRDGTRQSDPPPYWPPRPHKREARRTPPPPPLEPAPRHRNTTDPPHGGRTARSQVGGNRDRTAPPHKERQTEQGTGAGHAEGHGPHGTALPAPSAGTARGAHATPPKGGGGGRPRERERTRKQRARGDYQKGNRTELARVRETRTGHPATRSAGHTGWEGGNGRDTTPGTGPSPPSRPRALRTHGRGTVPTKAVVAHCATPQPLG